MSADLVTTPAGPVIPQWTLGDRLRKARESAGLDQGQLAEKIGAARNTVSNYEHGHTRVKPYILKEWALLTGVPVWWLRGEARPSQEPADYQTLVRGSQSVTAPARHLKAV